MASLRGIKRWIDRNGLPPGNREPLPVESSPPGTTLESLRRLERRSLLVVGCARSGTTALTRALNRSPEILLLEEPNLFANHQQRDFVAYFNDMHRGMGNPRRKGTYVRPAISPEIGPLPMLQRLSEEYRFVGEKVAIGPHDPDYDWRTLLVDYHAKYFFHARRLLILRSPAEVLWSMHKKFDDRPVPLLIETWLKCVAMCIDIYRVFPDVRVLFFEELGPESVARFGALLGLPIDIPPGMLDKRYVQSKLNDGDLPRPLQPYAEFCDGCQEIYRELRENFHRESLLYCGPRSDWNLFDDLLGRVAALLEGVADSRREASPSQATERMHAVSG